MAKKQTKKQVEFLKRPGAVILIDDENKDKTLEFGEAFLPDGRFWLTVRIGKELISTIKLNNKETNKLYAFLRTYRKEK
jgi:hypothetical protein